MSSTQRRWISYTFVSSIKILEVTFHAYWKSAPSSCVIIQVSVIIALSCHQQIIVELSAYPPQVFPPASYFFCLLHTLFFCGTGIWTQGFVLESRCSIFWATPPVHFAVIILEMGSLELFPGLALNLGPPYLNLPSRQDYRHETLAPSLHALW
jgi:hypothetical protein